MAKLVSKVYGDALFSLAVEENRVDELWDETRAMKQVLSENPDFMAILEHPEMTGRLRSSGRIYPFWRASPELSGRISRL